MTYGYEYKHNMNNSNKKQVNKYKNPSTEEIMKRYNNQLKKYNLNDEKDTSKYICMCM